MTTRTNAGGIRFESHLTAEFLNDIELADEFKNDALHKSIFTKKETLQRILGHGGRVALAILNNALIIGFAALDAPDPKERWGGMDGKIVMELEAVEVAAGFRKQGVALQLLSELMADPGLEEKILYLVSYKWIWDMSRTGLDAESYRDMLIRLFSGFGFKKLSTNEPNVCLEPENIFMVRMGKDVPARPREVFKWLCYGVTME